MLLYAITGDKSVMEEPKPEEAGMSDLDRSAMEFSRRLASSFGI